MACSAARRAIRQSSQLAPPGTGRWRAQRTQTLASRRAWRRLRERILACRRLLRGDFRPYFNPSALAWWYRALSAARRRRAQAMHRVSPGSASRRPHFTHVPAALRFAARSLARAYSAWRSFGSLIRSMPAARRRSARLASDARRFSLQVPHVRPPSTGSCRPHLAQRPAAIRAWTRRRCRSRSRLSRTMGSLFGTRFSS